MRSITELCGLRVSVDSYLAPRAHCNTSSARASDTQRNCEYIPRCVACGGSQIFGGCSTLTSSLCCGCGGNHTANYRGGIKWKEAKAALANKRPSVSERKPPQANPPL